MAQYFLAIAFKKEVYLKQLNKKRNGKLHSRKPD